MFSLLYVPLFVHEIGLFLFISLHSIFTFLGYLDSFASQLPLCMIQSKGVFCNYLIIFNQHNVFILFT